MSAWWSSVICGIGSKGGPRCQRALLASRNARRFEIKGPAAGDHEERSPRDSGPRAPTGGTKIFKIGKLFLALALRTRGDRPRVVGDPPGLAGTPCP